MNPELSKRLDEFQKQIPQNPSRYSLFCVSFASFVGSYLPQTPSPADNAVKTVLERLDELLTEEGF